ncbi:MAG: Na+/H+ antiporter NhaA [Halioglobus sp.]
MEIEEGNDPIDRITRPLRVFARHKLAGAAILLCSAVLAIIWANSPANQVYFDILQVPVYVGVGEFGLTKPLLLWINDGMMGVFFFVVGLEVKREFLAGELASRKRAMLPIAAAIGGMVVPAGVYALINLGGEGAHGWGIPMATDIAFALGVLALCPVPIGARVFLTALAIVDDIGSIVVIALFYTDHVALITLAVGALFLAISLLANKAGLRNPVVYFLIGLLTWLLFLKSGVHATLAAVLMAFTIPARTRINGEVLHSKLSALLRALAASNMPREKALLNNEQYHILDNMERVVESATAPLQQLEHALMPFVTFLVLPVFALANAGVSLNTSLGEALSHPVALGIVLGLFIGKPAGIVLFSWLAVRAGLAVLPAGMRWADIGAIGILAGIGFTMSLFITSLAFVRPELVEVAKVGILAGSVLSAVVGGVLVYRLAVKRPSV